jgi:hypothetical protein
MLSPQKTPGFFFSNGFDVVFFLPTIQILTDRDMNRLVFLRRLDRKILFKHAKFLLPENQDNCSLENRCKF